MSAAAQIASANVLPVQAGPRDARAQDDNSDDGAAFASLLGGGDAALSRAGGDRPVARGAAPDRASGRDDAEADLDDTQDAASSAGTSQPLPLFVYSLVSLAISTTDTGAASASNPVNDASLAPAAAALTPLLLAPQVPDSGDSSKAGASAVTDIDAGDASNLPLAATANETMGVPAAAKPVAEDGAREVLSLLAARSAATETKPVRASIDALPARAVPVAAIDIPGETESMSLKVVRTETHLAISKPGAEGLGLILAANRVDASELQAPASDQVSPSGKSALPLGQPTLTGGAADGRGAMNFAGQGGAGTGDRDARQDGLAVADPQSQAPAAAVSMAGISTPRVTETVEHTESLDAPSPATQVADRIATAISSGEVSDTSTGGAVRVLHIELKPQNLGSVTVRVSLKDNAVTMHIEAQRHETATAIERERDVLSTALKQAGYVVDGITAQTVDRTRADTSVTSAGGSGSMSGSDRPAAGQGGDQAFQSSGQRGSSQRGAYQEPRGAGPPVNDGQERSSRERSGALYV